MTRKERMAQRWKDPKFREKMATRKRRSRDEIKAERDERDERRHRRALRKAERERRREERRKKRELRSRPPLQLTASERDHAGFIPWSELRTRTVTVYSKDGRFQRVPMYMSED